MSPRSRVHCNFPSIGILSIFLASVFLSERSCIFLRRWISTCNGAKQVVEDCSFWISILQFWRDGISTTKKMPPCQILWTFIRFVRRARRSGSLFPVTHLLASGRKFAADKTENGPEISIVPPLNALVQPYPLVRTLYEILNSRAQSVLRTNFEYVWIKLCVG